MRLKKLVLQGYKTFASKTEFVFDEGITAIVGPNGSGKSNIADAVRWVLGEQSYSTLRGKRTIDMIFAGSQSRPRAGMAQAILTLDNSDGWLPIDYAEVEIGRRAHRSGENEYILNGQKVRLKDITELLAASGLSQRTYTIIGQGLIDRALSLKAEERRALFEEAAGINHYKSRRAETLRRLQETQRNLQRVHDILAEIRPRLSSLKRQATRARNYEQLTVDLNHLLRIWYGYKWEQTKKEWRLARDTAVSAEKAWQTSRQKLRVQQENSDDLRRRLHRLQNHLSDTQNQRDDIRDQLEQSRRQVAILQERRQSLQQQLTEIEAELPLIAQQRETAATALAEATADLETAQQQLSQNQAELNQFNQTFQSKQAEINQWQTALREAEQKQQQAQTRAAQLEGQLNQLRERAQEAMQAEENGAELAQAEAQIEKLTAVYQSAQNKADKLRVERNKIQEQRQELIRELKKLRREQRDAERDLNRQQKEMARRETRVEMLDQMRLKEVKVGPDTAVLGSLAGLMTIPDEYQTAVAAALASRLAALIVPDEANLWKLLRGDAAVTALALNGVTAPPLPPLPQDTAVMGRASDLVSYQPEAETAVQLLLGPILLVKDDKAAYHIAQTLPLGATAVTPDGFVAHAGGLVEQYGRDNKNSVLAREEAWRKGQKELAQLQEKVAERETAVSRQRALIEEKQQTADKLQAEEQRLGGLLNEANQYASRAQRDLDRQKQQRGFFKRQQENQAKEMTRLQERIAGLESQIAAEKETAVKMETAVRQAQSRLEQLPIAEAQQERENLRQNIHSVQTIVAGRQAVVDSRRATLNQLDQQLARLKVRQDSLRQQQTKLDLDEQEQARQKLQARLEELDAQLTPLKKELQGLREELAQVEEGTAVLQKETHDAETRYTQAKIAYTQSKSEIETLQERIQADLGIVALPYDDDQTGPTPLPIGGVQQLPVVAELPDDIEETIQNYRAQMQRMGAINPDAPEEFQETQDRFDFLSQQIDDLNQTEAQLRAVIAELDELTSRAFAETVEKVNEAFGVTFTQLFGGGSARLVLTDPDDLTISGVDIVARLPNRREQGLGLLSGGERALTAAALIFSLLKVSPTPFCIMDEVDAALDEANINRFRDQLRELSLKTQFIVITHNRGTVQAAQTIYGISMGSDSASQAISIKPEDYVK
ncbi:MAG: chromosome segregation protein SMC [Chloroflexi bacterium]|nr:chromosome segregation protein SMC [Chloroflexota bacterium]